MVEYKYENMCVITGEICWWTERETKKGDKFATFAVKFPRRQRGDTILQAVIWPDHYEAALNDGLEDGQVKKFYGELVENSYKKPDGSYRNNYQVHVSKWAKPEVLEDDEVPDF